MEEIILSELEETKMYWLLENVATQQCQFEGAQQGALFRHSSEKHYLIFFVSVIFSKEKKNECV